MGTDLGATVLWAMGLLTAIGTAPYLLATFISGFACGYNGGPPKLRRPRSERDA